MRLDLRADAGPGQRRDLEVTKAAVTGPDGKVTGVLTVYLDVTERRRGERAVREARDAAEEASRSKSEFIANISHELRTPLQSIIGFSELGEHRGQAASPRLASMFGDINRAGQRMLALVEDLLDVSRIESTVGTFHLERADLRPLVRDVVRELAPDVVPLDVMMPGELDGLQVCRHIKGHPALRHVRVVLLSARGQARDLELGREAGADAYLVKPFSPLQLIATLQRLLAPT